MRLSSPLDHIKGVGQKTAEQLALAGLHTAGDLLDFLPYRLEDYSTTIPIAEIEPGKATIKAHCEKVTTRMVRRGMKVTSAVLVDDSGKLQAVWFNQPYREVQLKGGQDFYFSGTFDFKYNRYQLTNPTVEAVKDVQVQTDRLLPLYRQVKGLKTQIVRKVISELRPLMTMLPETLPENIVRQEKLYSRSEAMIGIHMPETPEQAARARERFAFEEIFQLLLAAQLNKDANNKLKSYVIPFEQETVKTFVAGLPFHLTNAQRRAAWEILQDFEQGSPMNRLLQGDVGSGKTIVAGLAARQAASHGYQSAIMAPTEILAVQHAETLADLLEPFGVRVGLLTGSVKGQARKTLYAQIENNEVDVVVGTHALIQGKVRFKNLGFVVIDEQHRFGVAQRQQLLAKSEKMPHLLAMTATPIPRSLALTLYGELEVSILNELPAGRKPIDTKLWSPNNREKLYKDIEAQLAAGRQAYVICSLIDDNPDNEIKSVEAEYKKLNTMIFKHRKIGLLHGKMKPDEKEAVMQSFARGETNILVSTTVVEVGVNVPNATVMMIENADRFGLSQLHQLRGRVGRGEHQSYCYLVMSDSSAPSQRLREIEKSTDGFHLAEVDLELRGPGEVYGKAQHGALNLQVAKLSDTKLIHRAQKWAKWFVETDQDLLYYKELAAQIEKYQRLTTLN